METKLNDAYDTEKSCFNLINNVYKKLPSWRFMTVSLNENGSLKEMHVLPNTFVLMTLGIRLLFPMTYIYLISDTFGQNDKLKKMAIRLESIGIKCSIVEY